MYRINSAPTFFQKNLKVTHPDKKKTKEQTKGNYTGTIKTS